MARSRYKNYRTAIKHQTRPIQQVNYEAEPSKVMLLFNALTKMTNWDIATQEQIDNFHIVKEHNQYWRDKFAGRNPIKPTKEIDWSFYA